MEDNQYCRLDSRRLGGSFLSEKRYGGNVYEKILVPLDGSELAESVLSQVVPLAKCMDSEIVLLRIVSLPASVYAAAADPRLAIDIRDDVREDAKDYLNGIAAKLRAEGIKSSVEIAMGVVAETIQDLAANVHADLIAMSTHGRGGLARLMIGSVADQLIRNAHVPILLVRPQSKKQSV